MGWLFRAREKKEELLSPGHHGRGLRSGRRPLPDPGNSALGDIQVYGAQAAMAAQGAQVSAEIQDTFRGQQER